MLYKKMCVCGLSLSHNIFFIFESYLVHISYISERTAAQSCIQDRIGAESERERERERDYNNRRKEIE